MWRSLQLMKEWGRKTWCSDFTIGSGSSPNQQCRDLISRPRNCSQTCGGLRCHPFSRFKVGSLEWMASAPLVRGRSLKSNQMTLQWSWHRRGLTVGTNKLKPSFSAATTVAWASQHQSQKMRTVKAQYWVIRSSVYIRARMMKYKKASRTEKFDGDILITNKLEWSFKVKVFGQFYYKQSILIQNFIQTV